MSQETNESQTIKRAAAWGLALLLLLLLIMMATAWPGSRSRPIKPSVPTDTAVPVTYDAQFMPVSFPDLQADPEKYRDQRIRVTGSFTRLAAPDCDSLALFNGPVIRWGLIADELQMNAQGLEPLLHLIPPDAMLTVEGVWRRYRGPSGCGKEPETASVWYLVVSRIVQPNPLLLPGTPRAAGIPGVQPSLTPTAVFDNQLTPTPTAVTETAVTPTQAGLTLPTETPPVVPILPTEDVTLTPNVIVTPTATPTNAGAAGPTATVTATATETATPGSQSTATPGDGTLPPGAPTATPGQAETPAYPGPGNNPTPSPSYP